MNTSAIDKQLRFHGWLTDLLIKVPTEAKYLKGVRGTKKAMALLVGKPLKGAANREVAVPRDDSSAVRVRVYSPKQLPQEDGQGWVLLPALLWLHGGGYAIGVPEIDHAMIARFLAAAPCVVIVPDYRLSVEAPYPAALNDCYDTLLWVRNHAAELGVRTDQLFVGGNSAGGGLTAALSLLARDRGEVKIAFQMPLYPMIDDRMLTPSSQNNTAPVWDSLLNRWAWNLYLGSLAEVTTQQEVPAYAAPARAEDFGRLPPTATFVGDLEPFRDETIAYVEQLRASGVPVEFEIYPGCYHGFDTVYPGAEVSKRAHAFLMGCFLNAVKTRFASQT